MSLASIPWVLSFAWGFRLMLLDRTEEKEEIGWQYTEEDIKWDEDSTVKYPLVCTSAGIFAGLFGVGGGIVKGPLMLEMGVQPAVASASAAAMILFTSASASVSFGVFGMIP